MWIRKQRRFCGMVNFDLCTELSHRFSRTADKYEQGRFVEGEEYQLFVRTNGIDLNIGVFDTAERCQEVENEILKDYEESTKTYWVSHCNNFGSRDVPYPISKNTVYEVPEN